MNVEANRLQTFTDWPQGTAVNPERIAKGGFFSTRNGAEAECFSCHLKISEWNYGDQVMERHRSLSPNCSFVLNPESTDNVPLIMPSDSSPSSSYQQLQESFTLRLASFENWPASNIVSPESLARAGFYYLNKGDDTKCAFCKGGVRAWVLGDDPDIEHQRHFPNCPFVLNVINPRVRSRNSNSEVDNIISCSINEKNFPNVNILSNEQSLDQLGVQAHKGPKKSNFATLESRLRSYVGWSSDLIQTPDLLAQAGFYYEGVGDQVRCFHCDGGLKHWDPHDDPWTEHARWFPYCSFVRLIKGQEFVAACVMDQGPQLDMNRPTEKIIVNTPRRRVTEQEIQEHLSSPQALAALSIGLNLERVKSAIREKLEKTGRSYTQPDALVEAALNIQHDEEGYSSSEDMADSTLSRTVSANISHLIKTIKPISEPIAQDEVMQQVEQESNIISTNTIVAVPEKPVTLEEENRLLREARLCKICMDAEVGIVFLPCGHLTTCINCAPNLEDCPVCRCAIKATVRTFLS